MKWLDLVFQCAQVAFLHRSLMPQPPFARRGGRLLQDFFEELLKNRRFSPAFSEANSNVKNSMDFLP